MTIGVSNTQCERGHGALSRYLQRVVAGTRRKLQEVDVTEPQEGTDRIWIAAARNVEMQKRVTGDGNAARSRQIAAIVWSNGLSRAVGVGTDQIMDLVQIKSAPKMGSFASHIGNTGDDVLRQFMLNVQVVLLHIRPASFEIELNPSGKATTTSGSPDAGVPRNVRLCGVEHERRCSLKRLDVLLIPIAMFEEDAVTASNGPFAVSLGIPCEPEPRRRIEQVTGDASDRHSRTTAVHLSVIGTRVIDTERVSCGGIDQRTVSSDLGGVGNVVSRRLEVVGLVVSLAIGAEQADAQPRFKVR